MPAMHTAHQLMETTVHESAAKYAPAQGGPKASISENSPETRCNYTPPFPINRHLEKQYMPFQYHFVVEWYG